MYSTVRPTTLDKIQNLCAEVRSERVIWPCPLPRLSRAQRSTALAGASGGIVDSTSSSPAPCRVHSSRNRRLVRPWSLFRPRASSTSMVPDRANRNSLRWWLATISAFGPAGWQAGRHLGVPLHAAPPREGQYQPYERDISEPHPSRARGAAGCRAVAGGLLTTPVGR